MTCEVLALFDLDHTLLTKDSDEEWIAFLLERELIDRAAFEDANRAMVDRYRRGEAGALEFTEFYLSTLRRFTSGELDALHPVYMQERILPAISTAARELVAQHRGLGHCLILTTATSRFLTAPIALELGFEHLIATEPEMMDGRYTGRVLGVPNLREGKVLRLAAWLAERGRQLSDFRESWFYSDSRNDLPLLSLVTHPVAVNADPVLAAHARDNGWPLMAVG